MLPEPPQQVGAAFDAEQRIGWGDLEAGGQGIGREIFEPVRIGPQRLPRIGRKSALREHREARERESFGAADALAARCIAIAPLRSGAGIEQNADDRQIESRAAACGGVVPVVPRSSAAQRSSPSQTK